MSEFRKNLMMDSRLVNFRAFRRRQSMATGPEQRQVSAGFIDTGSQDVTSE